MKKVALVFVCLNPPYWPFLQNVIKDAKVRFLKNHKVDFFVWTDMPEVDTPEFQAALESHPPQDQIVQVNEKLEKQGLQKFFVSKEQIEQAIRSLRADPSLTIFPTEPATWPYPTLMRYHLFLQQEQVLKEYDYILYLDADMRIVDEVTDEVLGEGLTVAEHPMYSLRREYIPPYEPNRASTAYIPRTGVVIPNEFGAPWFKPIYAAGGFQGGTSESFIKAMKAMKANIDKDFISNYTAIWNDESHWNRYLYDYTGPINILSPAYIYPDSLIEEYYVKIWGKRYNPIIVTLTKTFSTSKEGGDQLREKLSTL